MQENHIINEKLPATQMGVLGLQHVLVMYASAILVPLILGDALGLSQADIAFLVSADIFTCGIATLLQVIGVKGFAGIRLPVIMGATLMTLPPMIAIGQSEGITAVFGSIIISGLFVFLVSFRVLPKLVKFFPTVVTGSLVTIVGLSLTAVGIRTIAGNAASP
ncbi:MAG: purine permease, partial [Clostridia bacterium]|nr:purine permease [Clostridia bacterium]